MTNLALKSPPQTTDHYFNVCFRLCVTNPVIIKGSCCCFSVRRKLLHTLTSYFRLNQNQNKTAAAAAAVDVENTPRADDRDTKVNGLFNTKFHEQFCDVVSDSQTERANLSSLSVSFWGLETNDPSSLLHSSISSKLASLFGLCVLRGFCLPSALFRD